ncbi:MAG: toll/interleukin-1 receptor domain-containing protein [Thiolinea sp.]
MPDIFVSYAHIDNQPFHGQELGWISHFIKNLGTETGRQMGRSEHFSVWMDFKLNTNDSVTPEIEQQLRDADVLLIMMSRGWLKSEWCVKELEYFSKVHSGLEKRVFVVNLNGVPREEQPESLHDLLTIPYYEKTAQDKIRQLGYPVPEPADKDYFYRTVDLAEQLAKTLQYLATAQAQPTPPGIAEPKATIYVAPVNDSLFDQRSMLVSELAQFGIQVLPQENRFDREMEANLQQCSHFVQLLDNDYAQGLPFDQHFTAQAAELPVLQWHDPNLKHTTTNHQQLELLNGKTVTVCELSDFARQVREAALPEQDTQSAETPPRNGNKLIFVHSSPEDLGYAEQIADNLENQGFGIALPRYTGDSDSIRKTIQRAYEHCDILLVLQQRAAAIVVEDYLSDAQVYAKKSPPILICQCAQAERLLFIPPGVKRLPCNGSFDKDCLSQFLQTEAVK